MRGKSTALIAMLAILGSMLLGVGADAQNVASGTLHSVATIVAAGAGGSRQTTLGSAFFVEVPSKVFQGKAFVYIVTARHNLLDAQGNPVAKPRISLEDSRTGALRDVALPPVNEWILDPRDPSVDLAALPFAPADAHFTTIPIGRFLNAGADTTIPVESQLGAEAYYLTTMSGAAADARPVVVTRFGRVSVAEPARSDVPGAGRQNLCFLEGTSFPELSGAPVFLRTPENAVLWGMVEARVDASNRQLSGLIGVLPASYIAETVQAMAAAQEQKP